ncbi:toll/interleukin-1 receptor domain-containing protein [Maioricimonas rarisocia]|nr:toll/interleukin-1 receptor domain-containing protein [Maioricimonas rarisocia]
MRIFLSYGHDRNEELVLRIRADLEQRGHDAWFDKKEIKAGDDWRRSITDGLTESDGVLSFLSRHSTRDPGVCLDEISIAVGVKGGNIQTVLVESEHDVSPPQSISHIQWLDMHDWLTQKTAGQDVWEGWYEERFAEILRVVESDRSRRFEGEIRQLEEFLKPTMFEARLARLLEPGFVGRDWLLDAVEKWRTAPKRDSRLLWITGPPGSGKSAFAAHLAHYGRDRVIAVQFCEFDKPEHGDGRRIVRTLAFQIATRLPDYRKLLLTLPEINELDEKNPSELFDYLLARPLQLAIGGGRERYLIVVDALDEANRNGRNEFVDLLARHADALPKWVAFVVTSRPDPGISTALQGFEPLALDTSTDENRDDVRRYLRSHLERFLQDRVDAEKLLDLILERGEALFLYAEHFCREVRDGRLSLDRPAEFPQGLGGIYRQYFQRQFPDAAEYDRKIRPALASVLAANEPLPIQILQDQFGWTHVELWQHLEAFGSLFPVTSITGADVVTPYHKSLADWLADFSRAGSDYGVDVQAGARELTDHCLKVARAADGDVPPYVKRHTASHLLSQERWGDLDDAISLPRLELLKRWTARGEQREGESCLRGTLAHLQRDGDHGQRVGLLSTQLARVLTQLGRHDEARAFLKQALDCATGVTRRSTQAIAWHELGSLDFYAGQYRRAIRCYRRALRLARRASPPDDAEAAANLVGLATIARTRQQNSKAIRFATEAIEHAESGSDVRHNIAARRILAGSLRYQMKLDEAASELNAARMLCVLHDLGFEQAAIELAQAWLTYEANLLEGRDDHANAAERLFVSALEQADQSAHLVSRVEAWLGLAWCCLVRLDAEGAAERLGRITALPEAAKYRELVAGINIARASLDLLRLEYDVAQEHFRAAKAFADTHELHAFAADAGVGLTAALFHQGEDRDARSAEREAVKSARRCGPLKSRLVALGLNRARTTPGAGPY